MSIEYLLLSLISPFLDPGNLIMIALGSIIGFIYLQSPSTGSKPQETIEVAMPQALEMVKAIAVSTDVVMAQPSNAVENTAAVVNDSRKPVLDVGKTAVQPLDNTQAKQAERINQQKGDNCLEAQPRNQGPNPR